jgi:signal transduction histidine kinase
MGPLRTGQLFVNEKMISFHYVRNEDDPVRRKTAENLYNALGEEFDWEILVLEKAGVRGDLQSQAVKPRTRLCQNEDERQLLLELQADVDRSFEHYGRERLLPDYAANSPSQSALPVDPVELARKDPNSPFRNPVSRLIPKGENYHYYQPIYWSDSSCTAVCHRAASHRPEAGDNISCYAYSTEDWNQLVDWGGAHKAPALRVMKVVMPTKKTVHEIYKTRAILLALAIATVFFSMIALYAVVRYVIVKPLSHLRDVSDEISRGNYDLRANIQTRDEFEELSASFNRMLRHLVDAQGKLRRVNIDLDAKVDQLAQANMQLHEMNRVKSDFLASMSHELRTPLNSIIGFADVLKENDSLSDKQKRYAQNIGSSGRALLEMINDILDLAKTESGKMDVRLTEFQITPVVTSQCDLVRSLSEEKNIDLTANIQQDLPPLYQDQGKIQQILLNLLSNAIKFTPEGGRITVTAERDPMRHLVLTVDDTGVGIPEEERRVIFEKFRQGGQILGGDHLTREFSGTGLGLSIVKELSKLLGGEVSFESELGKGSSFHVRVPWTLADRPKPDTSITQRLDEVTKPRRLDFSGATRSLEDGGLTASDEAEHAKHNPAPSTG